MSRGSASRENRILVRDGRRHHRPRYSRTELRIGLGVLAVLAGVVGWVAWEGAHPDPSLLFGGQDLTALGGADDPALPERVVAPSATSGGPVSASPAVAPAAARGPFPGGLAAPGWTEGRVSSFGTENLYEKIDGREGYYKSYGFRELWFVSLELAEDPSVVVDVEAYDLGEASNALGAYAGERPSGGAPEVGENGLTHYDRNALCLTRGRFYVRAIGSEESERVLEQLRDLAAVLDAALPGEPLPWDYALFVGQLGLPPGSVQYTPENAFSFGFARDVHSALLPDESEMFVVAAGSPEAAAALAERFTRGFLEYGSEAGRSGGVQWVEDRYIRTVAGAKPVGPFTIGIRGAPDATAAVAAMNRMETAVRNLPEGTAR